MGIRDLIIAKALDSNSLLCKFIQNIGVGRFVFRLRVGLFKVDNLLGRYNQRFIEYPWVLRKLGSGKGRLLLDVGCSGSLLDHELLARGFRVLGLDINDHTMRNSREAFVQANAVSVDLPLETFDVILSVSTIEHIGLDAYSQNLLLDNGDFLTVQKLRALLKPDGIFILTFPYEGAGPFRIFRFGKEKEFAERRYDHQRLAKMLDKFKIIDSAFFLCLLGQKCKFISVNKSVLDKLKTKSTDGSLGCLILSKKQALMQRKN
jgi:SAM-dependent methyltransferase